MCLSMTTDAPMAEPDWEAEITTLLNDVEVQPDGFGLYLNFMYRYNIDEDGEVDVDEPYKDDISEVKGDGSQTKFLLEGVATKYNLQMQYAFIKDPTTKVEAGYHYGLFYAFGSGFFFQAIATKIWDCLLMRLLFGPGNVT